MQIAAETSIAQSMHGAAIPDSSEIVPPLQFSKHEGVRRNRQARELDPSRIPCISLRSAQKTGIGTQKPGATDPFQWISGVVELEKKRHFFEARGTARQAGSPRLGLVL